MIVGAVLTTIYAVKLSKDNYAFNYDELLNTTIAGLWFFAGNFFQVRAFESGPGGPIIALVSTQVTF